MNDLDVIIVGCGLSGLTAGYTLLQKVPNMSLLMLESNETIGGQISSVVMRTSREQYRTFNLGAQWISSSQPHVMKIANDLGITLHRQYYTGNIITELNPGQIEINAEKIPLGYLAQMELDAFESKLIEAWDKPESEEILISSLMGLHIHTQTVRNLIKTMVKTSTGFKIDQISINQYFRLKNPDREFWVQGGTSEICTRLARTIPKGTILTNDPVISITECEKFVKIVTKNNKIYKSSFVILSIPEKDLLKIQFEPKLSERKIISIQSGPISELVKFVLTYETNFWRSRGFSGEVISCKGPVLQLFDYTIDDHPALTGFAIPFGPEPVFKKRILRQLARYWGDEALEPLDFQYQVWQYHTPRKWSPRPRLENCIAFTRSYNLNDAVLTGFQAAFEVLYMFRPQSVTYEDYILIQSPPRPPTKTYWVPKISSAGLYVLITISFVLAFSHFIIYKKRS